MCSFPEGDLICHEDEQRPFTWMETNEQPALLTVQLINVEQLYQLALVLELSCSHWLGIPRPGRKAFTEERNGWRSVRQKNQRNGQRPISEMGYGENGYTIHCHLGEESMSDWIFYFKKNWVRIINE